MISPLLAYTLLFALIGLILVVIFDDDGGPYA
jgi:hypothetical protein